MTQWQEGIFGTKDRIYYRHNRFNPKRKTLVLVHGLTGSSSAWIPYEKTLGTKFNFLVFDLRGHGKSFRPGRFSEYSIEKFSADLYRLLRHKKISKFILLGHSFGNFVVLDFLRKHQNMVRAVIFVGAHYAPSKRRFTRLIPMLALARPFLAMINEEKKAGHVDYSRHKNTGDWNLRRMYADIKNTGLKSVAYSTQQISLFNAEDLLPRIKIPTLIIHGNKDTIFPLAAAKKMALKIKNSRLVIFDGADHIIPLNYTRKLSKTIEDYIATLK